jgi:hypothetical protein
MELIVTTREDLQAIIRETVAEALQLSLHELQLSPQKIPKEKKEIMTINETVLYLCEHGYITTIGTMYHFVNKKRIPYQKINGKLVFERKAIDSWIDLKRTKNTHKQ